METISSIIWFVSGIVLMVSIVIAIGILIKKLFTRDWYFTRSQRIFCVLAGFGILLLISPYTIPPYLVACYVLATGQRDFKEIVSFLLLSKYMKKTITLPKKPVTKRDKHFYDIGARQQAEVFEKAYAHLEGELVAKQTPRKDLLNDYQKPIKVVAIKTVWYVVLGILFGVAFLYAVHGDQQALNAGLIH